MSMLYPIHVKVMRDVTIFGRGYLPLPKLQSFGGGSLVFPQWQVAFETPMSHADVNDTQRFYYLKDSLSGYRLHV